MYLVNKGRDKSKNETTVDWSASSFLLSRRSL